MQNKNFGKLIDGIVHYAPNPISRGGVTISNPSKVEYLSRGYMPIILTERPQKEGAVYLPYYMVEDNEIIKKWKEIILPEIPEEMLTDDDAG